MKHLFFCRGYPLLYESTCNSYAKYDLQINKFVNPSPDTTLHVVHSGGKSDVLVDRYVLISRSSVLYAMVEHGHLWDNSRSPMAPANTLNQPYIANMHDPEVELENIMAFIR